MALDVPPAWLSEVASDPEVRRLIRALALSTRFHFYILICRAPIVARAVLNVIERDVAAARGEPVRLVRLDPYKAHADWRSAIELETLIAGVLERLMEPALGDAGRGVIHVVDASLAAPSDDEAWARLFQRMNERRNGIAKRLEGEVILCVPPRLEPVFAKSAPDFWSIRSGEANVMAGAPPLVVEDLPKAKESALREVRKPSGPALPREDSTKRAVKEDEEQESVPRDASGFRAHAVLLSQHARALAEEGNSEELASFYRDAALREQRAAVRLRRHLLAKTTEAPEHALHALAWNLLHLGDIAYENSYLQEAMEAYEEALGIMRQLVEREPGRAEWRHDLALSLSKVGDVHRRRREVERAIGAYEEELGVRRRLLELNPDRAEWWQRDLVKSLTRLGSVHQERGELEQAMQVLEEARSIVNLLLERDPERPQWFNARAEIEEQVAKIRRIQSAHE